MLKFFYKSKLLLTVTAIMLNIGISFAEEKPDVINITYENNQQFPIQLGTNEIPSSLAGTYIELLQMTAKELGVKINFTRYPWKRCLASLESNEQDALFYASYKPEKSSIGEYPMKDGKIDTTRSLHNYSYVLYRLKGTNLDIKDGKPINLKGSIGVPLGYSVGDYLKSIGVNIEENPNAENNFKKLISNRLDGVADIDSTADYYLSQNLEIAAQVEKISTLISNNFGYLMFSHQFAKKYPEFHEAFWTKMAKIKATKYEEILLKYKSLLNKYR